MVQNFNVENFLRQYDLYDFGVINLVNGNMKYVAMLNKYIQLYFANDDVIYLTTPSSTNKTKHIVTKFMNAFIKASNKTSYNIVDNGILNGLYNYKIILK